MLRITPNSRAQDAKGYYTTADYYTQGQELEGTWGGHGASRLGLNGTVQQKDWEALCDNLDPRTGNALTPRQKQDRRVGYDFNFHVPKSVSILYGMTRDERILSAFRESVDATMQDMEVEMQTRVRGNGANTDRTTGNMVWGEFIHFTARPVDGLPDPHLHAHCFVFNTTWDEKESRWKAGQFAGIKKDGPFFEAVFHSRMARRLEELGLPVRRTKKGWELSGVPDSAIDKFSRRKNQIEDKAKELGVTNPDAKGELGARTRERKRKDLTLDELREEWTARMTPEELAAMNTVKSRLGEESIPEDDRVAGEAVSHAIDHCFERSAVLPERKLMAEALRRSYGAASPDRMTKAMKERKLVSAKRDGRTLVTTRDVLAEEVRMLDFARQGRGTCRKLGPDHDHEFKNKELAKGQVAAVLHVLNSRDRVILIRGAAGTGKTWMMREAVRAIEENGKSVVTLAPSADASRGVLRTEGFANAETVARFLVDTQMQEQARGQVVWIDEAGLMGTRQMGQVFDLAAKLKARVILSGDRRQHGSVQRGAALRLLEDHAGLRPAEIREIQRQDGEYRDVVYALSEGRVDAAFKELDRMGWIKEVHDEDRYKLIATDYTQALATMKPNEKALIVCPTHKEGERVTQQVREQLKAAGRLTKGEHVVPTLTSMDLTNEQRGDPWSYDPDDVLVFHQNAPGYLKGQRVALGDDFTPLAFADRFQAYRTGSLALAAGDVVRITRNGTAMGGQRLNNGALYTVRGFDPHGNITLDNGYKVSRGFGHLAHGYVVTSHASQGKSVKQVFIAQGSESFPASSREQFYVSVSRGKKKATIYTDDKEALLNAVEHADDRLSATELLTPQEVRRHRHRGSVTQRPEEPAVSNKREQDREELHRE
jgi:conjugative relaxase-like TrwC/TraI family protein